MILIAQTDMRLGMLWKACRSTGCTFMCRLSPGPGICVAHSGNAGNREIVESRFENYLFDRMSGFFSKEPTTSLARTQAVKQISHSTV